MTTSTTAAALHELKARTDFLQLAEEMNRARVDEAERRERHVEEMVPGDRSEFINGEIIMPSPWLNEHSSAIRAIARRLDPFVMNRELGEVYCQDAFCRLPRNDYYPDVCFWPTSVSKDFHRKMSIYPPPLLAVEVLSESTKHRDRGIKFKDYAAGGVREYWIVDPDARTIEQYLSDDREPYRLLRKLDEGKLKCAVIDGFELDVASVFE